MVGPENLTLHCTKGAWPIVFVSRRVGGHFGRLISKSYVICLWSLTHKCQIKICFEKGKGQINRSLSVKTSQIDRKSTEKQKCLPNACGGQGHWRPCFFPTTRWNWRMIFFLSDFLLELVTDMKNKNKNARRKHFILLKKKLFNKSGELFQTRRGRIEQIIDSLKPCTESWRIRWKNTKSTRQIKKIRKITLL